MRDEIDEHRPPHPRGGSPPAFPPRSAALGVLLGWVVARVGSAVAQEIMRRQDIPPMDLFAAPLWLVALAIGFGTSIAVLAG